MYAQLSRFRDILLEKSFVSIIFEHFQFLAYIPNSSFDEFRMI